MEFLLHSLLFNPYAPSTDEPAETTPTSTLAPNPLNIGWDIDSTVATLRAGDLLMKMGVLLCVSGAGSRSLAEKCVIEAGSISFAFGALIAAGGLTAHHLFAEPTK